MVTQEQVWDAPGQPVEAEYFAHALYLHLPVCMGMNRETGDLL